MGRRLYARKPNGRFQRPTLENMLGLSAPPCPSCGRLNPHGAGEPAPESCHACGKPMKPSAECGYCATRITFLGGQWTADDGGTACTDTSAPFVPHKPAVRDAQ